MKISKRVESVGICLALVVCMLFSKGAFYQEESQVNAAEQVTLKAVGSGTANYLGTPMYPSAVLKIIFEDTNTVPTDCINNKNYSTYAGTGENAINLWWYHTYLGYNPYTGKNISGYILHIGQNGGVKADADCTRLFYGLTYLGCYGDGSAFENIENLDVSNVTNMKEMFAKCTYGVNLYLGYHFDTSKVTNMDSMFFGSNFYHLSLGSKFNTLSVQSMSKMFCDVKVMDCPELSLGDLFDTSNVKNMSFMFAGFRGENLQKISLGEKFNTSNVENMESMFDGCGGKGPLLTMDIGNHFNTQSVVNMKKMFNMCGQNTDVILNCGNQFQQVPADHAEMFYGFGSFESKIYSNSDSVIQAFEEANNNVKSENVIKTTTLVPPAQLKDTEVTYTGNPMKLAGDLSVTGGTIYYSDKEMNGDNYKSLGNTSMPSYIEVGSYPIYYYIASTSIEYVDAPSGKVTFTIKKAVQPDEKKADKSDEKKIIEQEDGSKYTVVDSQPGKPESVSLTSIPVGAKGKLTIPTTVTMDGKTYHVTEIAPRAFYKNGKITSVVVGDYIIKIGKEAFYGCKKLKSVTIGNGLNTLDAKCFANCKSLKKITIGTALTTVGKQAFSQDTKLRNMVLKSKNIKKIGKKTLYKCHNLKIKVPSKKVKQYKKLFKGKGQKKQVVIKK